MTRLTEEDLRRETLRRQFPRTLGTDATTVRGLLARLGPIQSQVPRSPFLTAATRAPGTTYAAVVELFETHALLKASTLRGTVHTSVTEQFDAADALARLSRRTALVRALSLTRTAPEELTDELEAFCGPDWRTREEVVAHGGDWLRGRGEDAAVRELGQHSTAGLLWGHSGLVRRPPSTAWATRTDTLRRSAGALRRGRVLPSATEALGRLITVHLGAYGPVTADDLAFFFGVGRRAVQAALRTRGDEIVVREGPGSLRHLDLAEPPTGGDPDPGLRLLPEFDGVLLGYAARNRTRLLTAEQYPRVWAKANGLIAPVVLDDARIVATWRTLTVRSRTDVEVTMLPPFPPLPADRCTAAVTATATALAVDIGDVRVRAAT